MTLTPHRTIIIVFATFGVVAGLHLGSMPMLKEISGVSDWQFGAAGGIAMLSGLMASFMSGVLSRHFDHRTVLQIVIPLVGLTLAFALLVNSVFSFMLSFVLIALAIGTMDLFMNAEASIVEEEQGRKVFSGYHGAASLGIAVCAIVGSVIAVTLAPWFNLLVAVVPLTMAWAAVSKTVPHRIKRDDGELKSASPLPMGILVTIGLAAGFGTACETSSLFWAGELLKQTAPELAAISGLGLAFYGFCNGMTRLLGDRLRERFGDLRVMTVSLTIAIAGFTGLGLSPGFWWSVIAFAAVGCGLGVVFPCLFSLTGRLVPDARAAAMAIVAAVSAAPRASLPWLLGAIAQSSNVNMVFGACAIVAFIALTIIITTFNKAQAMVPVK
jgi:MFS family permease